MDMTAIIEKAIDESIRASLARIISKKLHSPGLQKMIDDQVQQAATEILKEPEFRNEVRRLMLQALQPEPAPALITVLTPQPSPLSVASLATCRFCTRAVPPGQVDCGICTSPMG